MANLKLKPGVITGNALKELFAYCKEADGALPAVNVIGSYSANAAMAAAKEAKAPIIIQLSHTGSQFYARQDARQRAAGRRRSPARSRARCTCGRWPRSTACRSCCTPTTAPRSSSPGSTASSRPARSTSRATASRSSARTCSTSPSSRWPRTSRSARRTLTRIAKMNMTLEIELGITGGEEDGVDNSGVEHAKLYTQPRGRAARPTTCSSPIGSFTVAASFGNTHGVYAPGNVKLKPTILRDSQKYIQEQRKTGPQPVNFVFHGGSGSTRGGDPRGGLLRRREDEHRHRHAVGLHAPDQEVHGREGRLPACRRSATPRAPTSRTRSTSTRAAGRTIGEKGMTGRLVQAFKELGAFGKFEFLDPGFHRGRDRKSTRKCGCSFRFARAAGLDGVSGRGSGSRPAPS